VFISPPLDVFLFETLKPCFLGNTSMKKSRGRVRTGWLEVDFSSTTTRAQVLVVVDWKSAYWWSPQMTRHFPIRYAPLGWRSGAPSIMHLQTCLGGGSLNDNDSTDAIFCRGAGGVREGGACRGSLIGTFGGRGCCGGGGHVGGGHVGEHPGVAIAGKSPGKSETPGA